MNVFLAFFLTFIIELIVYFILVKEKKSKIVLYCLLINAFTWPLAQITYSFYGFFWLVEAGVFLIEGILISLLFKINWKKAFIISLIANFLTSIFGFLLIENL